MTGGADSRTDLLTRCVVTSSVRNGSIDRGSGPGTLETLPSVLRESRDIVHSTHKYVNESTD
ncbi:hypothetical protein HFX_1534 [Haloferax mediterranei ATCC 33500]|uniref:Uncharacterized protein n=1 Tax=Haloferax mediterranei (strain ATCC 33500 / DSM 1411 / JCM 8866 / NBRC 14739 / NCIMB 2177 / R-4) TaxID=523841 RepID=I3R4T1_HALMT|nr:hypothetical protein HFX_1534 [Haloferax mediterranei ATCC 33500]